MREKLFLTTEDFENILEVNDELIVSKTIKVKVERDRKQNSHKRYKYFVFEHELYDVSEEKGKVLGYFQISDNEYWKVVKKTSIWPIWLLLLLLILFSLIIALKPKIKEINRQYENGYDWDGQPQKNGEQSEYSEEMILIPGYSNVVLKEESLQLYNPTDNTVDFVYLLCNNIKTKVEASFENAEDASLYVKQHTIEYNNTKEDGYSLINKKNGELTNKYIYYKCQMEKGKYNVIRTEGDVIYFTDLLAPGKAVDWDARTFLKEGENAILMAISTYDTGTGAQCYGATQMVNITVK